MYIYIYIYIYMHTNYLEFYDDISSEKYIYMLL